MPACGPGINKKGVMLAPRDMEGRLQSPALKIAQFRKAREGERQQLMQKCGRQCGTNFGQPFGFQHALEGIPHRAESQPDRNKIEGWMKLSVEDAVGACDKARAN